MYVTCSLQRPLSALVPIDSSLFHPKQKHHNRTNLALGNTSRVHYVDNNHFNATCYDQLRLNRDDASLIALRPFQMTPAMVHLPDVGGPDKLPTTETEQDRHGCRPGP